MIIRLSDPTDAAEARRHAVAEAEEINLGEKDRGSLAIAVTEMATNVVKHAGSGTIVVERILRNGSSGVRILGLDKGPGIRDIGQALRDGYSTAGTAGNGLGAIKRLSHGFDIYTASGFGTAVLAEFWAHKNGHLSAPLEIGSVCIPIKGEEVCGDAWGVRKIEDAMVMMVVDGLGHGVLAAEAAHEAEQVLLHSRYESPASILQNSHDAMKKTRGAAMAVAALNVDKQTVSFAGIGNIGASIVRPTSSRGMASHNGTLGHQLQRIQEFTFPWNPDSILVMHSDGLKSGWDLAQYPGIWGKHPGLIAGMLYRDYARERDDVTVLIARNRRESDHEA
jgi:anti-sigma regulatory factor (Ser/Thr protein kinase)